MAGKVLTNKYQAGKPPGRDFDGGDSPYGLKVALVTRVDEINMKADLKIMTAGVSRFEIDLTQGMAGPRSFWGGVPEENSLVIVGYRRIGGKIYDASILGYIPVGNRSGLRFDPWAQDDPSKIEGADAQKYEALFGGSRRYKRLILRPGDVGGMSSAGSELVLSKDARITNRGGESIELRDADRTMAVEARHKVEAINGVRRISGPARRSTFYLPDDVTTDDGRTLKTQKEGYFGRDELESAGPGDDGADSKWVSEDGVLNDLFNDSTTFPHVRYANGRKVFYVGTKPSVITEDPDAGARTFVEDRMEMDHTTDQEAVHRACRGVRHRQRLDLHRRDEELRRGSPAGHVLRLRRQWAGSIQHGGDRPVPIAGLR